jgi:flagellar assembly factor FliW
VDDPKLSFVVLDPTTIFPNYTLEKKDFDKTIKWNFGTEEITCFVIVSIPKGCPEKMTANFMAPVVINNDRREGIQLILQNSSYSYQHPILS